MEVSKDWVILTGQVDSLALQKRILGTYFRPYRGWKHYSPLPLPTHFHLSGSWFREDSLWATARPSLPSFHMREEGVWKKSYPPTSWYKSIVFLFVLKISWFLSYLLPNWFNKEPEHLYSWDAGWERACFSSEFKKQNKKRDRSTSYKPPICAKGPKIFWPPLDQVNHLPDDLSKHSRNPSRKGHHPFLPAGQTMSSPSFSSAESTFWWVMQFKECRHVNY